MRNGTPQYSRRPPSGRTSVLSVAVRLAKEGGEAREAWVDVLVAVRVIALVEPPAAFHAQAGTVGPAERVHRLRQGKLVVEDRVEVDLMMLVDALRRAVLGVNLDRRAGLGIDARKELLVEPRP